MKKVLIFASALSIIWTILTIVTSIAYGRYSDSLADEAFAPIDADYYSANYSLKFKEREECQKLLQLRRVAERSEMTDYEAFVFKHRALGYMIFLPLVALSLAGAIVTGELDTSSYD